MEKNKCDELKFYKLNELPNNIIPYIKKGLEEFKELICRVAWHEYYGYDKQLNEDE